MTSLSSHVLDTALGIPARQLHITLTTCDGVQVKVETDDDGRCSSWGEVSIPAGVHQLRFHTEAYLEKHHGSAFYPFVDIHFRTTPDGGHYHIPLLLSPFGISSYRGS